MGLVSLLVFAAPLQNEEVCRVSSSWEWGNNALISALGLSVRVKCVRLPPLQNWGKREGVGSAI